MRLQIALLALLFAILAYCDIRHDLARSPFPFSRSIDPSPAPLYLSIGPDGIVPMPSTMVPTGSRVIILTQGIQFIEVRIASGPKAGLQGWVPAESVR